MITEQLATDEWVTNLPLLTMLNDSASDEGFLLRWHEAHQQAKRRLVDFIARTQGIRISEDALFDVMVKRIHEYKRQLLNIMYVIYRYQWIKSLSPAERAKVVSRVVFFGGKVAVGTRCERRRRLRIIARRT